MEYKIFKRKLSGVIRSEKTQRDNIQELIVAGLVHYEQQDANGNPTGDSMYLTELVRALQSVQTKKSRTVAAYISEHANLGWGKLKDKKFGFKSVSKGVEVRMPTQTWYEWDGGKKEDNPDQTYDMLKTVKGAITKAINEAKKGHLKEGQEEYIKRLQDALDDA